MWHGPLLTQPQSRLLRTFDFFLQYVLVTCKYNSNRPLRAFCTLMCQLCFLCVSSIYNFAAGNPSLSKHGHWVGENFSCFSHNFAHVKYGFWHWRVTCKKKQGKNSMIKVWLQRDKIPILCETSTGNSDEQRILMKHSIQVCEVGSGTFYTRPPALPRRFFLKFWRTLDLLYEATDAHLLYSWWCLPCAYKPRAYPSLAWFFTSVHETSSCLVLWSFLLFSYLKWIEKTCPPCWPLKRLAGVAPEVGAFFKSRVFLIISSFVWKHKCNRVKRKWMMQTDCSICNSILRNNYLIIINNYCK